MSSFRASTSLSPRRSLGSRWRGTRTLSAYANPPSAHPRTCRFGSTCVKFGCPFQHPPSRPQDCPDGQNCLEAKCPLHHPKSRPIPQYEHPKSWSPMRCTKIPRSSSFSRRNDMVESKTMEIQPCGLSFSNVIPQSRQLQDRGSHSARAKSTSRYSDRIIVRSPMVVPSPNNRPRTGYLAATSKPCVHGTACAKYGCTYKHPASRATNCTRGNDCTDSDCTQLHPLNVHGTGAIDAGFAVGQQVQAKFLPNSKKWSDATILHMRGSALTLQFNGFSDAFEVPLRHVRPVGNANEQSPTPTPTPVCPCSPPPSTPPPPRSSSSLSDLQQLEQLKQAAVAREDFVVAEQIKQRIATVRKITDLREQKQQAVSKENFMLAMNLKTQIDSLLEEETKISDPKIY